MLCVFYAIYALIILLLLKDEHNLGMSMKRLAVIGAVGSGYNNISYQFVNILSFNQTTSSFLGGIGSQSATSTGKFVYSATGMRPGANLHGNVNILLGG